jgi:hypothetical protein
VFTQLALVADTTNVLGAAVESGTTSTPKIAEAANTAATAVRRSSDKARDFSSKGNSSYGRASHHLTRAFERLFDERMLAVKRTRYLAVERRADRLLDRSELARRLGRSVICEPVGVP